MSVSRVLPWAGTGLVDSCSWVKEMLDIVGVGARTKFGRYTKGLWGGAGVKVTEGDILLLDSASVDVDGDSRGGVVVSSRGGVAVVRVAATGDDTEEDGESASLSDLDLSLLPNTVELRGGRNLGVEIPSMVTSGGTGNYPQHLLLHCHRGQG